jgi:hypothetical protein
VSLASWLVIAIAIAAANLPFVNDKRVRFLLKPASGQGWQRKPLFVRLLEMVALSILRGRRHRLLARIQIGTRFPQTWEFYAP